MPEVSRRHDGRLNETPEPSWHARTFQRELPLAHIQVFSVGRIPDRGNLPAGVSVEGKRWRSSPSLSEDVIMSVGTHESRSASMMPSGSSWATWCPRIYRGRHRTHPGQDRRKRRSDEESQQKGSVRGLEEEDGWVGGRATLTSEFWFCSGVSPTSWKPALTGASSKFTQLIPRGSRWAL